MNMVVAGDGHTNIRCENSALPNAEVWPIRAGAKYDFILTNPPFGTTESDSLTPAQRSSYPVPYGKGQHLFVQRMVMATKPGGLICTVIDDGLLNTESGVALREWVMQHADLLAVIQLPDVTFKPNKINVRSSILLLRKKDKPDLDLLDTYPIAFGMVDNLGYHGTGDSIRGFDFNAVRESLAANFDDHSAGPFRHGPSWRVFDVPSTEVISDDTKRWDRKYWEPDVRKRTQVLIDSGNAKPAKELNTITTSRGKGPAAAAYVAAEDGHAVVVKAGSNITRFGNLSLEGADWIEKQTYDDIPDVYHLQPGDVLLSSTGAGTLGKCAVWDQDLLAVADSHVTVLRVDPEIIDSHYLADYLRVGFGQDQIQRLYTGSTGLIELTTEHVNSIVVPLLDGIDAQQKLSQDLRSAEAAYTMSIGAAETTLAEVRDAFDQQTYAQTQ
jgi:type I restriction enzyme M protein